MAEILAKEEAESILWQKRYKEAITVVFGSSAFFWKTSGSDYLEPLELWF